jgi:hypothetical protein
LTGYEKMLLSKDYRLQMRMRPENIVYDPA